MSGRSRTAVRWCCGLLVVWFAASGCARAPDSPGRAETPAAEPSATDNAPHEAPAADAQSPLPARVDAALARAANWLMQAQSSDGAWRSDVYATFRGGDALTPLAVVALQQLPGADPRRAEAIARGLRYLDGLLDEDGAIRPPADGLAYGVYTAANILIALSTEARDDVQDAGATNGVSDSRNAMVREAWLRYLRERQLTEPLGWQPDDPFYGGWGYAAEPFSKPANAAQVASLAEPNLSATLYALIALRAAGVRDADPAFAQAMRFVERCQNFPGEGESYDQRFDDGGFFFVLNDPVRNKAGVTGTSADGRPRFASYGSTTVDGLRALALCGAGGDDTRVVAARQWLEEHFAAESHPGQYVTDREGARQAVYFYYAHSLAHWLRAQHRSASTANPEVMRRRAELLAEALLARQRGAGSWINAAVDVREDDPVVATCLAVGALAQLRVWLMTDEAPLEGER